MFIFYFVIMVMTYLCWLPKMQNLKIASKFTFITCWNKKFQKAAFKMHSKLTWQSSAGLQRKVRMKKSKMNNDNNNIKYMIRILPNTIETCLYFNMSLFLYQFFFFCGLTIILALFPSKIWFGIDYLIEKIMLMYLLSFFIFINKL